MKRCIVILLALLLLAACGGKEQAPDPAQEPEGGQTSVSEPVPFPETEPEPEPENDVIPLDESSFTEEQRELIRFAESMYIAHMEVAGELSDAEKADFFRFMISSRLYESKREEWKAGDQYIIPLADVEAVIFTHLDTKDFDPVKGFQGLPKGRSYDEEKAAYIADDIGGYGGAAAFGVLEYTEDGGVTRILLGLYDMNLYFSSDPVYRLIKSYEVVFSTAGGADALKVLSAGEPPATAAGPGGSGEAVGPDSVTDASEQTPPRTDDRLDEAALIEHARTLTEHIAFTVFESKEVRNGERPPQEKDMGLFTIGASYYRDRQGYWYHDVAVRDQDLYYHFPEERIKSMVYQVFGFENWMLEKDEDPHAYPLSYRAGEKEFYGGLEFGFGTFMECDFQDILVDTQSMRVAVDYDLYTTSLFPDQEKIGAAVTEYSIRFLEDGSPYLRYEGTVITPSQG